jgi:hypothetical protein
MPRDKKPGLLHLLLVPKQLWQHVIVDFKHCPKSKAGNNIIVLFINCLGKRLITIPIHNMIIAK